MPCDVLVRCDQGMQLTDAHACCMCKCTRKQLNSGEVCLLLFCSARELIIRPKGLVVLVNDESTGDVLRRGKTSSCKATTGTSYISDETADVVSLCPEILSPLS